MSKKTDPGKQTGIPLTRTRLDPRTVSSHAVRARAGGGWRVIKKPIGNV